MQIVEKRIVPILNRIHRSELLDAVAVSLDAIPARCAEVDVLTADGEMQIQVVEAVTCPVALIGAKVPKRVCDFVGSVYEAIARQGSLRLSPFCLLDEFAQTVIGVALSIRLTRKLCVDEFRDNTDDAAVSGEKGPAAGAIVAALI